MPITTKCRLAAAMLIGVLAPSLMGSSAALGQQADMLELTLATAETNINPTTDSVLKLADTMGFYEKHGLKVTIVALDGTPQAVAALNAGAVDLADISIDAAIRVRADNDLPIRGIVSGTLGAPYLIAVKSDITSVGELAGKTFAIADNGSLDHTLAQLVLGSLGVTAADGPLYVPIGAPSARVQALAAGRVDATAVSYGTFQPIAKTPGISILVSPETFSEASPGLSKFVATLDHTIAEKPEALQRFVDALIDASRSFEREPERWVTAVAAARDDLTVANLEETAAFFAGRWCVNGCMNKEALDKTVAFIYANPDFKDVKVIGIGDVVDFSFIDKTLETTGAYDGSGLDVR